MTTMKCDKCGKEIEKEKTFRSEWKEIVQYWCYCSTCGTGVFRKETKVESLS